MKRNRFYFYFIVIMVVAVSAVSWVLVAKVIAYATGLSWTDCSLIMFVGFMLDKVFRLISKKINL